MQVQVEEGLISVALAEQDEDKTKEEEMNSECIDDSGALMQAVRRLSSAAYDMVTMISEPGSSKRRDGGWLELKAGNFATMRDKLQIVVSLARVGVWTPEEKDDLLEKLAAGVIDNLPESTYARYGVGVIENVPSKK